MFRNPVTDLIIVAVVALLIFGPKRLPMLGRSLGQGLREFKEGITGESKGDQEEQPALEPATDTERSREPAAAATPATPPASPPPASERESAETGSSELRS